MNEKRENHKSSGPHQIEDLKMIGFAWLTGLVSWFNGVDIILGNRKIGIQAQSLLPAVFGFRTSFAWRVIGLPERDSQIVKRFDVL
jgi:hypothetical protein